MRAHWYALMRFQKKPKNKTVLLFQARENNKPKVSIVKKILYFPKLPMTYYCSQMPLATRSQASIGATWAVIYFIFLLSPKMTLATPYLAIICRYLKNYTVNSLPCFSIIYLKTRCSIHCLSSQVYSRNHKAKSPIFLSLSRVQAIELGGKPRETWGYWSNYRKTWDLTSHFPTYYSLLLQGWLSNAKLEEYNRRSLPEMKT